MTPGPGKGGTPTVRQALVDPGRAHGFGHRGVAGPRGSGPAHHVVLSGPAGSAWPCRRRRPAHLGGGAGRAPCARRRRPRARRHRRGPPAPARWWSCPTTCWRAPTARCGWSTSSKASASSSSTTTCGSRARSGSAAAAPASPASSPASSSSTPTTPGSSSSPRARSTRRSPTRRGSGNQMDWYSTTNSPFGSDMGAPPGGGFQVNVFLRVGDTAYRTYNTQGRGTEQLSHTLPPDRPAALRAPGGVAGLARGLAPVPHLQPVGPVGGLRPVAHA